MTHRRVSAESDVEMVARLRQIYRRRQALRWMIETLIGLAVLMGLVSMVGAFAIWAMGRF